jgi:hypothetical protein
MTPPRDQRQPPHTLLTIPRELKDEIYAHLLAAPTFIDSFAGVMSYMPKPREEEHPQAAIRTYRTLSFVCHQVSTEAKSAFFRLNIFDAKVWHGRTLSKVIPRHLFQHMRRIVLCKYARTRSGCIIPRYVDIKFPHDGPPTATQHVDHKVSLYSEHEAYYEEFFHGKKCGFAPSLELKGEQGRRLRTSRKL